MLALSAKLQFNSRMPHIIAVANQKGGVGKTTSAVNLAAAFSLLGKKTLLIDLDPQGNASSGLGLVKSQYQEANLYHVFAREITLEEVIIPTRTPNLFVVPCTQDLSGSEVELAKHDAKEHILKDAIKALPDFFDVILIDCAPSLGYLTLNGLSAAHYYVIPLQCEYFALEGLSSFVQIIQLVRRSPRMNVPAVIITARASTVVSPFKTTPPIRPPFAMRLETSPSTISKFVVRSSVCCMRLAYRNRSLWQREEWTAGPLLVFSWRKWIPVRSALMPISPPIASISLTS